MYKNLLDMTHRIMLLTVMSTRNFTPRQYQIDMRSDILSAWASGAQNVMAVLGTGAGKTVLFTGLISEDTGRTCAIAHRKELVSQISLALNKRGVQHFCLAPDSTVRWIVSQHILEHGESYYRPGSRCMVASVDTLISRGDALKDWCGRVGLWVLDEGHHCLRGNKWGKAVSLFPNARGLLVTATPCRSDGRGLGRHSDGVVDRMIVGPSPRDLINAGYLTDYRIFAPPSGLDLSGVTVGSTGDYTQPQVVDRVRKSRVIGDVVDHYLRIAPGQLGVTFVPSVEIGADVAGAFRAAGVPAEVVSAKTADPVRAEAVRRLRRGDVKELVNVDIFGEGFDLPAISVVSFARPTFSYGLYVQQFGRGLRPMPGKTHAIIIDHVGNVMRHGLPDSPRQWTLDAKEKRSGGGEQTGPPLRVCTSCTGIYSAYDKLCPYCGAMRVIADRSRPEFVDGDLTELDPATLASMRGGVARVDEHPAVIRQKMQMAGAPPAAAMGAAKQHRLRQEAQAELRGTIALWAGWQRHEGRPDSESYQRFYREFGVDVLTAQTLGRPEAERLTQKIRGAMG